MQFLTYGVIAVLLHLIVAFPVVAEDQLSVEEAALSIMMQAISQNDYEAFIDNGAPQFKRGITKPAFTSVVDQVGRLIRDGYQAAYLTQLNQHGHAVHLWKISYATSDENTLAKLILVDNRVAGFWLQ